MESLALWMAAKGYQKLEDDFWPNHYRLARLDGDFEIDNRNNVLGRCKLAFDCRPEWYRKNVEDITIVNDYTASTVFNPTSNTATPVIVLRLNQAAAMGGISIGSNKVTLDMSNAESLPDDMTVVFDCDSRNAWSLDGTENLNQWVVVNGDYPSFSPGENTVSMDSSVVSCTITPRWWDLTP
jgi:phage-related protein